MATKESLPFDLDRAAWFIHESNLIEEERSLSRKHIRAQLKKGTATGHVGAFAALMGIADDGALPRGSDLCNAQALIVREQCGDSIPSHLRGQVGRWRSCEVSVGDDCPPPAATVAAAMETLHLRTAAFHQDDHAHDEIIDYVADAHHALLKIHPFADGNGRVSRLYANALLSVYGLPLAVFTSEDRFGSYYHACSMADPYLMRAYLRAKITHPQRMLSLDPSSG